MKKRLLIVLLCCITLVAYAQIDDGSGYTTQQLMQRTSARIIQLANRLNDNQKLVLARRLRAWTYRVESALVTQHKEDARWEASDLPPAAIQAIKDRNAQKVQEAIDSAAGFGTTQIIEPEE